MAPEPQNYRGAIPRLVPIALLVAMGIIGFAPILVRLAGDAPAMSIVAWRTIFAVLLLAPLAAIRASDEIKSLSAKDWMLTSVAGIFLGLHFAGWTASLFFTSVASASVLVTSSPLFLVLFGWLILREKTTRRVLLAVFFGVSGATLIGLGDSQGGDFPQAMFGNGLALSAALAIAVYFLISRAVRARISPLAFLFPVYVIAAVVGVSAMFMTGASLQQPMNVIGLSFLLALGPQLIAHGAFNYAIRYVPAAVVGLTTLAEPVIASLLALLLFSELPTSQALLGMLMVVLSIAVVQLLPKRKKKVSSGQV